MAQITTFLIHPNVGHRCAQPNLQVDIFYGDSDIPLVIPAQPIGWAEPKAMPNTWMNRKHWRNN